jgi:hypothetical protein
VKIAIFVAVLALGAISCGGGPDSFSCNNAAVKICSTETLPAGFTFTSKSCEEGTAVASCAATELLGKCTRTAALTISGMSTTKTIVTYWYTGHTLPVATLQEQCVAAGGTFSAT